MSSTAFENLMKTENIVRDGEYIRVEFLGIVVMLDNLRQWFNLTNLKKQFDRAAFTKSDNAKKWIEEQYGEYMYFHSKDFKLVNNDYWVKMELFDRIVADVIKRKCAVESWLNGEEDWKTHFVEFIYIRRDPKYQLDDWIVKGGRAMNLYGRDANYKQHSRNGPDDIFAVFFVKYGSPAESKLKDIFAKHFKKIKKAKSGVKLGKEHYLVPNVDNDEQFGNIVIKVAEEFAAVMCQDDLILDEWYKPKPEVSLNTFVRNCMPWARVSKE